MVKFFTISLVILFILASGSEIKLSEDLVIKEIEEGVYVVTHSFPWQGNSLVVFLSGNDVIFVDTPYNNESTRKVVEWIKNENKKANIIEINTGFHNDNLGGNEYLLSQNIPVYGSELTAELIENGRIYETIKSAVELMKKTGNENQECIEAYKTQEFKAPNRLFDIEEGLELTIGEEIAEVYFPGESHSIDNVVVYFHKRKILFGGCMVKSLESKNPGFTEDANMQEWPKSVKNVLERYKGARIVIPGHGNWGDTKLLNHTIELLVNYNEKN
ncbi:subclass B1 metallo-beta-lactamase [candidate division WOR-3 bacterium]|nr:subclass B1 metallo-beta-lactamase [candidate division WOR-3 bacterium]